MANAESPARSDRTLRMVLLVLLVVTAVLLMWFSITTNPDTYA